ncbi:MAG: Gfo/Idh/MocA family oxidoreductase [Acidobacteria bacterium]|nr:Gfo/Idh/MocA family oxidoreductase [Acidobacteriota bacterium]MBI3658066.1 Gfo/Idh/MocA family oxidoreductase [Acidobacteriota bacterium]
MSHEKYLGVGIVGTGWVSSEHIRAFEHNPFTSVSAICSREKARGCAKAAAMGLHDCTVYDDYEEMLKDTRVQIVSIATPHHLHAQQGTLAAQAGKHILLEKPMALDWPSLQALVKAVQQAGVKTVVSFVLRWNPLFQVIRSILAQGTLGDLFYAEVDYLHGIGPWYPQYPWNITKAMGGSSLLTAGCHAVDGLRWFLQREAVEVYTMANFSKNNPLKYEYEPNSVTLVRFADGVMAKVASSVECAMPYVFDIKLLGEQGTLRNNQIFTRQWQGQTGWATIPTILPDSGDVSHHPFIGEIDHLVECIRTNTESHVNVADAYKTHEICLAAQLSAASKQPVMLPLKGS